MGSSLSPTLFNIYVAPLERLIRSLGFSAISYADDTQIIVSVTGSPADTTAQFHTCLRQVGDWMATNCLKLNSSKTEVLLFAAHTNFWYPDLWPLEQGPLPTPVIKVKNLGVTFDSKLSFESHFNQVTSLSFYTLKLLRKILPFIPAEQCKLVVSALVLFRADYCNGLFINLQKSACPNYRWCRMLRHGSC